MKAFAQLFEAIDSTTKTNRKIDAIIDYFNRSTDEEKLFAIAVLIGNKPKRPVKTTFLREWIAAFTQVPLWLFEESYYVVGDLAETMTLLTPTHDAVPSDSPTLKTVFETMISLRSLSVPQQKEMLFNYWTALCGTELFLFNKMLTGNLRVGVSRKLVIIALAKYLGLDEATVAHRMMGRWDPMQSQFSSLLSRSGTELAGHIPYPFYLAYPLAQEPTDLGAIDSWLLEKKLDGIRGQIIRRNGELFIWSRGEDLLTDKFPEFDSLKTLLPDGTVIDGEIIPWKGNQPLPFARMQTRIGRKILSQKILKEVPLVMVCFDLLEHMGRDIRSEPLSIRRAQLTELVNDPSHQHTLLLAEEMKFRDWGEAETFRKNARLLHCEGLMIKNWQSAYGVGRRRGDWWKWKTDPLSIDAVMIYAQSGHGRRANLYTDYTFAVWEGNALVPFAKAYSGLTDVEIKTLDRWIKQNTLEKFGPVRSVAPKQVFEIGFEGIQRSNRHKSGVALRFPRILRWRLDKAPEEANTKHDLLDLLRLYGQ